MLRQRRHGELFRTLKTEQVHHEDYPTRAAVRSDLFEYIEVFYNRQRPHSFLDYRTPVEFEERGDPSLLNFVSTKSG